VWRTLSLMTVPSTSSRSSASVAVAPSLDAQDAEAVLGVEVGDPLDKPGEHLVGRLHAAHGCQIDHGGLAFLPLSVLRRCPRASKRGATALALTVPREKR
jgi:hypothetical protein